MTPQEDQSENLRNEEQTGRQFALFRDWRGIKGFTGLRFTFLLTSGHIVLQLFSIGIWVTGRFGPARIPSILLL